MSRKRLFDEPTVSQGIRLTPKDKEALITEFGSLQAAITKLIERHKKQLAKWDSLNNEEQFTLLSCDLNIDGSPINPE